MVTSLFDGYLVDEEAEKAKESRKAASQGKDEGADKDRRPARRRVNRLVTTVDKAKALKPLVDRLAILAKKGDEPSYRRAMGILTKGSVVNRLFEEVKERKLFAERDSGFLTMGRIGIRKGDAAVMAAVSLITPDYVKVGSEGDRSRRTVDRRRRVEASRKRQQELEAGNVASKEG
jgi:large subunit ribosomal protein L17